MIKLAKKTKNIDLKKILYAIKLKGFKKEIQNYHFLLNIQGN